ncbi:hypothetical protein BKA70DRAFT_1332818, partial [Coprinopsis sp. MPI-PUGE-AT-0042]
MYCFFFFFFLFAFISHSHSRFLFLSLPLPLPPLPFKHGTGVPTILCASSFLHPLFHSATAHISVSNPARANRVN